MPEIDGDRLVGWFVTHEDSRGNEIENGGKNIVHGKKIDKHTFFLNSPSM